MTRAQFDAQFAATVHNTEGFTPAQLATINERVFAAVADLDPEDAHQEVKAAFQAEFDRW